jgi:hypothetical protein
VNAVRVLRAAGPREWQARIGKIPVAAAQVRSGNSAGARTPTRYFGGGRPALIEKTVPYGPYVVPYRMPLDA